MKRGDTAWMLISSALRHAHGAGPGAVLRRHGPPEERPRHDDAEHGRAGRRRRLLDRCSATGLAFGPSLRQRSGDGGGSRLELGSALPARASSRPTCCPATTSRSTSTCMFQGMFAIITPALISGAVAERIRFWPFCLFMLCGSRSSTARWPTWSGRSTGSTPTVPTAKRGRPAIGLLGKMGALDFAGGTVVHIAAGFAGLACRPRAAASGTATRSTPCTRTAWC